MDTLKKFRAAVLALGAIAAAAVLGVVAPIDTAEGQPACGRVNLTSTDNLAALCDKPASRTALGLGSIATQASSSVTITGGTINGTTLGATTPAAGTFSTLAQTGTGAFYGPAGTTGERPTATAGGFRYNSTTGLPEYANGSAWTPFGTAADLDGLSDVVITSPALGQCLKHNGTNWVNVGCSRTYGVAFGNGSTVTAAGAFPPIYIEDGCEITKAVLMMASFDSGSTSTTSFDLWASSSGIPTVSNKISGTDPVATSAAAESVKTSFTGWTTAVAAGTRLVFNMTANDHATSGTIQIVCK